MTAQADMKTNEKNTDQENDLGGVPSRAQREWLRRGLQQSGGKLPLFNEEGQQICERTVRSCIEKGWAQPWFSNPLKPDWIVCKLTDDGRKAVVVKNKR